MHLMLPPAIYCSYRPVIHARNNRNTVWCHSPSYPIDPISVCPAPNLPKVGVRRERSVGNKDRLHLPCHPMATFIFKELPYYIFLQDLATDTENFFILLITDTKSVWLLFSSFIFYNEANFCHHYRRRQQEK